MTRIYINGVETRRKVDDLGGKRQSMRAVCIAKGIEPTTLNSICIRGYGQAETISRLIKAGIPVVLSDRPVPSRLKKLRSDSGVAKAVPEEQKKELFKLGDEIIEVVTPANIPSIPKERHPEQISFEDFTGETKVKQMRDIITKGLTAIINELNKI